MRLFEPLRKRGQRLEETEWNTTHASDMGGCRLVNRWRIHPGKSSPARSCATPCNSRSRAGASACRPPLHFGRLRCAASPSARLGSVAGSGQSVSRGAGAHRRAHGLGGAAGRHGRGGGMACRPAASPPDRGRPGDPVVGDNRTARIPCRRRNRVSYDDAIAETILADERAAALIVASARAEPDFRRGLAAAVETYLGSRTATAEIATGFVAAGLGALVIKQATPGLVTLSSALAGMIAQQMAIAAFPLGAGLGGLWYSLFPAAPGPGTPRRHDRRRIPRRRHAGRLFRRVTATPCQRRLGLHRVRLERLLRILEADLCGEPGRNRLMRDHYVARLIDIFDLIALAMRESRA